jgi:HEAT repeat protein
VAAPRGQHVQPASASAAAATAIGVLRIVVSLPRVRASGARAGRVDFLLGRGPSRIFSAMSRRGRVVVLLAVVALGAQAGTPPPARAADWAEAKRAFAESQKAKEWQRRRDGFTALSDHDKGDAVEAALGAVAKESHGAVLWAGVSFLSGVRTPEARDAVIAAAKTGKGARRWCAILGLLGQFGDAGKDALLEALKTGDPTSAMLAAEALGKKNVAEARTPLVEALKHKDWQVRAAAARGLGQLTGAVPKEQYAAMLAALEAGEGVERQDLFAALEALAHQGLGYDADAWKRWAAGEKDVKAAPKPLPHAFGVPVFGRRVAVVLDRSTRADDPHPFEDIARLKEVCRVPGGRDVPWYSAKTILQLYVAHAKRLIDDLPDGAQVELVTVGGKVSRGELGRLSPASAGTRAALAKALAALKPEASLDLLAGLDIALDSGGKDPAAFSSGPDEVVVFDTATPWNVPTTDPDEIVGVATWKARVRGVRIVTVGVGGHPFDLLRRLAEKTDGTYVSLTK